VLEMLCVVVDEDADVLCVLCVSCECEAEMLL
jgi:hypothetical protein